MMNGMYPMQSDLPTGEKIEGLLRSFSADLLRAAAALYTAAGGGKKAAPTAPEAAFCSGSAGTVPEEQPEEQPKEEPKEKESVVEKRFKEEHFQRLERKTDTEPTPHEVYVAVRKELEVPQAGGDYPMRKIQGAMLRVCVLNRWRRVTDTGMRWACYLHGCKKIVVRTSHGPRANIWFPEAKHEANEDHE